MTPRVFGRFWNRALPLLLVTLGSASGNSLAAPPDGTTILRIHGSNTVGAKLAPMLVAGLFEAKGLQSVRIAPAGKENEQRVNALDERGKTIQALVAAHGTGTGFAGLKDGTADLAAASRPIKQSEAQSLAALGDLRSAESEQVIAIDGLAVIVHPDNPVQSLSVEQVARLFSGEIANWRELGGANAAVELHARDDQSGTYDTFKELVLGSQGKTLATNATRYESNDALSLAVSRRSGAIGFVGLASVGKSKALAITDGDSQPMPPTTALVATEDYPLSRRLFLYADPQKQSKWTREFLTFVHSPAGQAIVEKSGYVAQAIAPISLPAQAAMPAAYQQLAREAQRLTVNFRFAEGSAQLDNKAQRDVQRLIDYLNSHDKQMNAAVLVGFGDARNDPARTALLSKLRAMAVRRELARGGILVKEINGLGDQLPVASNSEAGRIKNRRVEVWVY
ncbi:substrate-binding domain-containing protein [Stutzerimonas kunmingensis]|uniref:substrate-binding domain-containing protein n=1 Tax=Stutzerimonas kunmingensis TaxID=1211807 RepID=UPI0028A7A6E0|nr:substrate-binding domain-containing protein [Stutzerimonas kunmingensis]